MPSQELTNNRSLTVAALTGAGAASFMAWAVRGRSASVFGRSVWRGPRDRRGLALTFDDGPGEGTPDILETLAEYRGPPTLFQGGGKVDRLPENAHQRAERGGARGQKHPKHPSP